MNQSTKVVEIPRMCAMEDISGTLKEHGLDQHVMKDVKHNS
jgi:hypothetical protein